MESLLERIAEINLASQECRAAKIAEGEIALGVMSDDLKRLYHLRERMFGVLKISEKTISDKIKDLNFAREGLHEDKVSEDFHVKIHLMLEELQVQRTAVEAINEIFSGWMKFEFPALNGKVNKGVREGYTVVCSKEEELPFFLLEIISPQ